MPIVQLATLRIRAAIPPSFILGERLDKKTSTVITRIMGMTKEARMLPTPETNIAESGWSTPAEEEAPMDISNVSPMGVAHCIRATLFSTVFLA